VRFVRFTLPDAERYPPKSGFQSVSAPEGRWREDLRNGDCPDSRRLFPL
jgi:hypothetical protein